ncbi:MAG TPA: DUF4391 family protein [Epsilonproteobacteria bacterium]|nr:DUF4391 family protein [Campylobacterota bacterium]
MENEFEVLLTSDLNRATKKKFVPEVDKILWRYKLSKETTNLAETKAVSKIQIFNIYAKEKEVGKIVLETIDRQFYFLSYCKSLETIRKE